MSFEFGMKDFDLRFFAERRWPDGIIDLLTSDNLPETPGAYILGAADSTKFIYPWGSSPIYYIGKADFLLKRLSDHKKFIIGAIEDHAEKNWWPRYQYGASFGAKCAWYSIRGTQNPNKLENDLISTFYDTYGSIPVANGMWPSGLRQPTHGTRED